MSTFQPCRVAAVDSVQRALYIFTNIAAGGDYDVVFDSAAITDIYGLSNDKDRFIVKVKSEEDYANLTVKITPYQANLMVQLVNDKDVPQQTQALESTGEVHFRWMKPGVYYLRLFIDENNDGLWTTGDYDLQRQPEQVVYCPRKLNLRANWEFEETWNWQATPILEQKPDAIRKDGNAKKK